MRNAVTLSACKLEADNRIPTGQVDGGWWPRSTDLAAELPDLFSALVPQIRPIERVSYHRGDWSAAPRKIRCEGAVIRLGDYHWQCAATVDVLIAPRTLTLRVVSRGDRLSRQARMTPAAPTSH